MIGGTMIEKLDVRNRQALAKAISIIEDDMPEKDELLEYAYKNMKSDQIIIGITGPGGTGKSTLIDKLIGEIRKTGKTVGVLAVDPSSPYSGGAFLGDRVRMSSHNTDRGVFIRSLGSRGAMGGISSGTKNILYLYKVFGFDYILIESLGVGQDETEITNFVDVTVVTLVPGYGDEIQMSKAGIQEIADIFVINKSDKPDAESLRLQLENTVHIIPEEIRPIILNTVASENAGVDKVFESINSCAVKQLKNREKKALRRIHSEIKTEVNKLIDDKLKDAVDGKVREISEGNLTPFTASKEIVQDIVFKR